MKKLVINSADPDCEVCEGTGWYYKFEDRDCIEGYKQAPRHKCDCYKHFDQSSIQWVEEPTERDLLLKQIDDINKKITECNNIEKDLKSKLQAIDQTKQDLNKTKENIIEKLVSSL